MAENPNFRRDEQGNPWHYSEESNTWAPVEQVNPALAVGLGLGSFGDQAFTAIKQMTGTAAPGDYERMMADRKLFEETLGSDQYWATAAGQHLPGMVVGAMTGGVAAPLMAGAVEGALAPAENWGERAINTGVSTAMSGAGIIGGNMMGRVMSGIDGATGSGIRRMVSEGGELGDDVAREVAPIIATGEGMGFKYLPGTKLQDPLVKGMDLGAMKKPSMRPYFDKIMDNNNTVVSRAVGDALDINPQTLDLAGGKITADGLAEARNTLGNYFGTLDDMVPEVKIGKPMADHIRAVGDFKDLKNTFPGMFDRMDEGIISGAEYRLIRSNLGDVAKTKGGTVADGMGGIIDDLDNAVSKSLPEGEMERFARRRSQYSLLQGIESGKALRPDGTFNTDTLINKVKNQVGQGNWHENNYSRLTPEMTYLTKVLKQASDPRVKPLVGTSGTGEGLAGMELFDAAMSGLGGDVGAIRKVAKEGAMAKMYEKLAETDPRALAQFLYGDQTVAQKTGAAMARGAGAEIVQDWD